MEGKGKRPPINIREMEEGQSKPERGPLEYMGSSKPKRGTGRATQVLLSAVVALVLAVLVMFQYSASKSGLDLLDKELKGVSAAAAALGSKLDSESKRVDSIINTMGGYAKLEGLTAYPKRAELEALDTQLRGVNSRLREVETFMSHTGEGLDLTLTDIAGGVKISTKSSRDKTLIFRITLQPLVASAAHQDTPNFVNRPHEVELVYNPISDRWEVYSVSFTTSPVSLKAGLPGSWEVFFDTITPCSVLVEALEIMGAVASGRGI